MIETAVVFNDQGEAFHWHDPPGRSGVSIPDSRDLWEVLWSSRGHLGGVAHTHPWSGPATASGTDLSTFAAIDGALGTRLLWPVVTFDAITYYGRRADGLYVRETDLNWWSPSWLAELRERSRSNP